MEQIDKARTTGQSIDAGIALVGTYYYLLATATWPEEVEQVLQQGIALTSGKPWRDAANALFAHAKHLAEEYGSDEDEDDEDDEDEDEDDEETTDE